MRWILNALYLELLCGLLPVWLWKLPRARRYRAGLLQRLGFVKKMPRQPRRLWVHTVSVGEASIPKDLIAEFRQRNPDWEVAFSTSTDTGAERLRSLYPGCPVFYWPLDLSFSVEAALERVSPRAVMLVELEVWPNFLASCLERRIPVAIVNGRINESSVMPLRVLSRFCPQMWGAVKLCCARSELDAERFVRAGLSRDRVFTTGSLKYDALVLKAEPGHCDRLRRQFGLAPEAPVLVAGSTHPGEDEKLCEVYKRLRAAHADLRLILVPRHIERAAALAKDVAATGLRAVLKSELDSRKLSASGEDVAVVDTVGELIACYSLGTVAFVGRSLLAPGGGQNMLEPAALGKPVLVGPHIGNFEPEVGLLTSRGALVVVKDEQELEREVDRLLSNPGQAAQLGEASRRAVMEARGATERTLKKLEELLSSAGLAQSLDVPCRAV